VCLEIFFIIKPDFTMVDWVTIRLDLKIVSVQGLRHELRELIWINLSFDLIKDIILIKKTGFFLRSQVNQSKNK
jgi:hypothetical protein